MTATTADRTIDASVDLLPARSRGMKPPTSGNSSAGICALGNLATRLGRSLQIDPETHQVIGDDEANAMLARKYREGHWAIPEGA